MNCVIGCLVFFILSSLVRTNEENGILNGPPQCDVYCQGPLLETIQKAHIFPDSKTFVDMPMKADPHVVLEHFHMLTNHTTETLLNFLKDWFLPSGSELLPWTPTDWTSNPKFLSKIQPKYKQFATNVNQMWQFLGKTLDPDVLVHPTRYSIIPQPYPFIVPGDRFHEFYYWDSYWIVSGLLVCDMKDTALGIIRNGLALLNSFGFIPNGARVYYLNRSQPPLLSEMVMRYLQYDLDLELLDEALPLLLSEYLFWMNGEHAVNVDGHVLNRFYSANTLPRPESYWEDYHHASQMEMDEARSFYSNIAAGAESGEDYTSRWFRDGVDIRTIDTANIIPVDLNSFMYKFESNMLEFYKMTNKTSPIDFETAMKNRKIAMDKYLWNSTEFQWFDYSLSENIQLTKSFPSNWFPLWSGAHDSTNETLNNAILQSFLNSGLYQQGGVQASTTVTGQQWDSPNVWAPHQSILAKAFQNLGTPESIKTAERIANSWIEATNTGYDNTQMMHEKYNAYIAGEFGGGGEYPPQIGFGWTNGVTLEFLDAFSA